MNMDAVSSPLTDDFLLTLVHDLRSYVRRSLSGIQLAERSLGKLPDPDFRQRFEQVINANRDLEKFLARIADYANAGHPSGGTPLPLSAVVQAALLHHPSCPIEVGPFPPAAQRVKVPPEMVRVFAELIDNALKFSRNGPVSILVSETDGDICVMVCDSGIGIPAGEQERVFDLLMRLHSRDDYPGFGLGLPICRRTAELAGALVSLAPNPTGGTRAGVSIPTTLHSATQHPG